MRRAISLLIVAILTLTAIYGCQLPFTTNTRPPATPSPTLSPPDPAKLGTVERDIIYATVGGFDLKMDVYYTESAETAVPAVLYVHGGAWTQGDKSTGAGEKDITELTSRGYIVAAVNYRLAPQYKFPAQIEDVKSAVRYLRVNAGDYGIDSSRIGAYGGSAGGHLVAMLGATDKSAGFEGSGGNLNESSRVKAVCDMFGPADLSVLFAGNQPQLMADVFGTTDYASEIVKKASPVTYVTSDDPPFLILHGDKDNVVPLNQSVILYKKLKAANVPVEFVIVRNGGHSFTPTGGIMSPGRAELSKLVADFFDRYLK